MDNISYLVAADTEEMCPVCSSALVITPPLDGVQSELSCDCSGYLVA